MNVYNIFRFQALLYLFSFVKFALNFDDNKCNITDELALSAFRRANSIECKNEIQRLACLMKTQKDNLDKYADGIYRIRLRGTCPYSYRNELIGCQIKKNFISFVNDYNKTIHTNKSIIKIVILKDNIKNLDLCIDICISVDQYKYAAYDEKLSNCYCIKNLTFEYFNELLLSKNEVCNSNLEDKIEIYDTGLLTISKFDETYTERSRQEINEKFVQLKSDYRLPRIVFLLSVNGRSIRQIFRLFKTIYNDLHFYYFHVDERMTFLRREIENFISSSNKNNIKLADWSMPTIWGGSDLLKMHLKVMQELVKKKQDGIWQWDFLMNLSETDFPIKSIEELTLYLNENRDKNFVKFHHSPFEEFSKNQGVFYAFLQCENRMWKLGERELPLGIQFGGGSDWFCLNHDLINYIINSNDPFIEKLMTFFNYTLLPSETFFHTVILNTKFCNSFKNSHLRFVNWQRKRGCNCQYKHIVDWCGCSPNMITLNELFTIQVIDKVPIFFARKFDPLFENHLINIVDQSLFGLYTTDFKALNSYWHNVFDDEDTTIDTKLKILFDYLLKESNDMFLLRFKTMENHFKYTETFQDFIFKNMQHSTETRFRYLKSVNAFFEANKFKGYVITIKMIDETKNRVSIVYETFFKMLGNKILMVVNDDQSIKQNQTLFANKNLILKNMIKFKISTDYDIKERRFSNYASLMNQNSNPCLLMEFDPFDSDLEPYYIQWLNSKDELVKETEVKLGKNDKPQQVLNTFFKKEEKYKFLNDTGIWKIKIVLFDKETTILERKFLILPNVNPFIANSQIDDLTMIKQWSNLIKRFWSFDSLCINTIEDLNLKNTFLFDQLFKKCHETKWSTFYPDPKSDVYLNLHVNLNDRIN